MTTIKIHYNGWVALPVAVRRVLSLDTGDVLEVQVVDGRIALLPVNGATRSDDADRADVAKPEPEDAPEPARTRRPQRAAAPGDSAASLSALPPALRARGRRKVRA